MTKVLILGSKEYPLGTNTEDVLPSGGIEVYVEGLVSHLSKTHKIEIVVITRRFVTTSAHEKTNDIEIFRVPWVKGFFFRNISFNFMAFLKSLRIDFDIIHSHGPVATFFGLNLSKIKKVPIITKPHGLVLEQPQYHSAIKWFFSILERLAYSRADVVVFSSEQEKDGFRKKLGFLPRGFRIITPGIDVARFEAVSGDGIKKEFNLENRMVVTFVGRLIQVKGLEYLIEGIKKLDDPCTLLIVGGGPQRIELESLVSKLNLQNIIFTGHRADVPEVMAATDIFVLPSLSEGLPMALLEAMASGTACVVTDIGLPVEHRKDALVVKAGDAGELGDALGSLLKDRKLRKQLGDEAKRRAKMDFSWKKAVDDYLKLFNDVRPKNP